MKIAKFIGDPADDASGPRVLRLFGRTFPKGRFVAVEGTDADAVFAKLSANRHFETAEGEPDADQDPIDLRTGETPPEAAPVSDDGGDARTGVIARLEAIQAAHPEVEFDRRWALPRLKAALEAAEFEHGED
jgi:hypothetical protein